MKRLPMLISFVTFVLLCMSLSYWGMQVFKPKVRSVSAPPGAATFEPGVGQWGSMFGRNPQAEAAASNYQLKGVVVAPQQRDSAAIISTDGKPAQTVAVGREVSPGVTVQEVQSTHILISEAGAVRRVDLPQPTVLPGTQMVYPQVQQRVQNTPPAMPNEPVAPVPEAAPENSR
jgi:general secretion pathway protein C